MKLNISSYLKKMFWNFGRDKKLQDVSVLVATGIPGFVDAAIIESVLGRAFVNNGKNVCYVVCQGVLPACHLVKFRKVGSIDSLLSGNWKKVICTNCVHRAGVFKHNGSIVVTLDEMLNDDDRDFITKSINGKSRKELSEFSLYGINIAEHARSGALRFLAIGNAQLEERYEDVFKIYLEASILTLIAFKRILEKTRKIEVAYLNHGIYTPQGVFNDLLKQFKINFYTWNMGYRIGTVLFSRSDTYHKTMIKNDDSWRSFDFDEEKEKTISEYLSIRASGTQDWVSFSRNSIPVGSVISSFPSKYVSLFTNVNWDAQIHFENSIFESHLDWVVKTINYFRELPDVGLVIRVHPAEFHGATPSRQRLADDLKRIYTVLPANVILILPDNKISSYELALNSTYSIVYGSKMGIELPAMGCRVIVAGDSWAKGKGFTYDCVSEDDYLKLLGNLLDDTHKFDIQKQYLAKRYSYYYFFKRLVNIRGLEKNDNGPLQIKGGLNFDEIAKDSSFISIANQMALSKEVMNEIS